MPLPIALINQTPDEIGIVDMGLFIPPGSGTVLDLTGLNLIEEVRDSGDLETIVVTSGLVVISGGEGVLDQTQAARFFTGSQIAEQNFTTEGIDLRDLRNVVVLEGENIVVVSGETPENVLTFQVNTTPDVVTDALIGSGELTVTSGSNIITLSGSEHPPDEDDVDSLTASGVTLTGSIALDTAGGVSLIPDAGSNTITISGGITDEEIFSSVGKIYKHSFGNNGIIADKWAETGHGNPSNQSPHEIVFSSQLIGISFSNRRDNVRVDVGIYKSLTGAGTTTSLEFTWELDGVRVARKSDLESENILFAPGDKLAMFFDRPTGTPGSRNPQDPIVDVYLQIDANLDEEGSEDYSGDF